MGTKNNPGQYDCHARAGPDEPLFTLRAKDPSAPYFVMAWAAMRQGRLEDVANAIMAMQMNKDVQGLIAEDGYDKLEEARKCAVEMIEWRKKNVVQQSDFGR